MPRKLRETSEAWLVKLLENWSPGRTWRVQAQDRNRLQVDDPGDQWEVWRAFLVCLRTLEDSIAVVAKIDCGGARISEDEFEKIVAQMDKLARYMSYVYLFTHASPTLWTIIERMAQLLAPKLVPIERKNGSQRESSNSPHPELKRKLTNCKASSIADELIPTSEEVEEEITSDSEIPRQTRFQKRKRGPHEVYHDFVERHWSLVTIRIRHWLKSVTQWTQGIEDVASGKKQLGIFAKNLAVNVSSVPVHPSHNQQESLPETLRSTLPESEVENAVETLRQKARAKATSVDRAGILEQLSRELSTDPNSFKAWTSSFTGVIHCEAQLASEAARKHPMSLRINDGDVVKHGKVYPWAPPRETPEDVKQDILRFLQRKLQKVLTQDNWRGTLDSVSNGGEERDGYSSSRPEVGMSELEVDDDEDGLMYEKYGL
ncbi:hypothetical protein FRB90_002562 [Tulasnella sp. 427]|nr:hypothetical protein FRB90_002562 [Tulasnella sp. 427]